MAMIAAVISPSSATKNISPRRNQAALRECRDGDIDAFGILPAFSMFQILFVILLQSVDCESVLFPERLRREGRPFCDLLTAHASFARLPQHRKHKRTESPGKSAMTRLNLRNIPEAAVVTLIMNIAAEGRRKNSGDASAGTALSGNLSHHRAAPTDDKSFSHF
jgi:hypothetical protein